MAEDDKTTEAAKAAAAGPGGDTESTQEAPKEGGSNKKGGTKKVIANVTIEGDDGDYAPGDELTLPTARANRLLKRGAVSEPKPKKRKG